jgi:gas vesicle protein
MNNAYNNERLGQPGNVVSGTAVGFICGALIGAGVALLMAPASGAETRRRLGETAQKLRREVPEKARGLANQARSTIGALQEGVSHGVKEGRAAFAAGKDTRTSTTYATEKDTRPVYTEGT